MTFFFLDLINSEGGRGSQHDSASGERILFLSHVGAWLFHGPLTANLIHTEQSSLHSTCQCCIEAVTRLQCTSHNTVPVGVREAAWSQIHILWALDERVTWKMVCLFVRVPQVKKKTKQKTLGLTLRWVRLLPAQPFSYTCMYNTYKLSVTFHSSHCSQTSEISKMECVMSWRLL